ncbi:MAG: hypothetical protein HOM25_12915 [Rhodospirillaceae bacterium]|jgi:sugar O-acyltransferase (sialic acid O-acetyltransferase NeuD family)|nr:hypothetical protein [Rhodospirillaceae bacterium]MBT5667363.1 hypothetical protein [Rhodospirillaceae bacterium]MBT5810926.1 hypothetical protein [Rhodospirillaceae bacterium]
MDRVTNSIILVGAGGHACGVVDAITGSGGHVAVCVDPKPNDWLETRRVSNDDDVTPDEGAVALGVGGVTPEALKTRLALLQSFLDRNFTANPIIHPTATVSPSAVLEAGVTVLANAVIQPFTHIESGVIVNTGAIVEHHSSVAAGAHIAPGAIVLGQCHIGSCCMIGAGAVILQKQTVAPFTLVKAVTRFPESLHKGDRKR